VSICLIVQIKSNQFYARIAPIGASVVEINRSTILIAEVRTVCVAMVNTIGLHVVACCTAVVSDICAVCRACTVAPTSRVARTGNIVGIAGAHRVVIVGNVDADAVA